MGIYRGPKLVVELGIGVTGDEAKNPLPPPGKKKYVRSLIEAMSAFPPCILIGSSLMETGRGYIVVKCIEGRVIESFGRRSPYPNIGLACWFHRAKPPRRRSRKKDSAVVHAVVPSFQIFIFDNVPAMETYCCTGTLLLSGYPCPDSLHAAYLPPVRGLCHHIKEGRMRKGRRQT